MTTKFHVCYGPNTTHFVEVPDGSAFQTGQPNDEVFEVRDDAARRAFELNYTGFREFSLQEEYEDGEYVVFRDDLYRATATVEPYVEDPAPDPLEPAPVFPTPPRDPSQWLLITIEEPEELTDAV